MLVDAARDLNNVRKSQEIIDIKAYDARLGVHSSSQKKNELATLVAILKYCTNVQHM